MLSNYFFSIKFWVPRICYLLRNNLSIANLINSLNVGKDSQQSSTVGKESNWRV